MGTHGDHTGLGAATGGGCSIESRCMCFCPSSCIGGLAATARQHVGEGRDWTQGGGSTGDGTAVWPIRASDSRVGSFFGW